MKDRKSITIKLSQMLEDYIDPQKDSRVYWSKEVTFNNGTKNKIRVDYMRFVPLNNTVSGIEKGDFFCYEVKSSVEDFHSKNGHNMIGEYNYYVMLKEVFERVKEEIPYYVGVLVPDEYDTLISIKKAHRKDRDKPMNEMLLMMFRSAIRKKMS